MYMKKVAASILFALATLCLLTRSARAATEPPCDTVCGCSTGCARGCTDGGRIITCGVFGDCHTLCKFAPASTAAGPAFAAGVFASPATAPAPSAEPSPAWLTGEPAAPTLMVALPAAGVSVLQGQQPWALYDCPQLPPECCIVRFISGCAVCFEYCPPIG